MRTLLDAFSQEHRRCDALDTGVVDERVWMTCALTEAVALSSGSLPSRVVEIQTRERRKAEIQAQLEDLDGLAKAPRWDKDTGAELRRRLTEWHAALGCQPALARQILRKLLVGRLRLTPKEGWYEIAGQASYGALLTGVVGLVPGGGIEPP